MVQLNTFGDIMREKARRQLVKQDADISATKQKLAIDQGQLSLANRIQNETMADRGVDRSWRSGEARLQRGFESEQANKERGFKSTEAGRQRRFEESQAGTQMTWRSGEALKDRTWRSGEAIDQRNAESIERAKDRILTDRESTKMIGAKTSEGALDREARIKELRVKGAIDQGTAEIAAQKEMDILNKTLAAKTRMNNDDRFSRFANEAIDPTTGKVDPIATVRNYRRMEEMRMAPPDQVQNLQMRYETEDASEMMKGMNDKQKMKFAATLSPEIRAKLGIILPVK